MSKICKYCNYGHPDSAHYCAKCGKPLETEGFVNKKGKEYIVVAKSDYESKELRIQMLSSENDTLKQNWWYRFSKWFKKIDWKEVLETIGLIILGGFWIWLIFVI